MEDKILQIINSIRASKGYDPLTDLTEEKSLRNDLGLDSFDLAELTVHIEAEYGVDIFSNGLVHTVGEIFKQLRNKNN